MAEIVERLTLGGQGQLADGTLLDRVLPGEEVEPLPDGTARVMTPVPERVRPPCRHFKTCGGCVMQHASDDFVATWKIGIVEKALSARGLEFPFRELHTSPPQSRRRARFSGRRTKKGALVGFHAKASDMVVDVAACTIVLPSILAVRPALDELTLLAASRKSEVGLTVTDTENGADIFVEADRPVDAQLRIELAGLADRHDLSRLTWNDEIIVTRRQPIQRFGDAIVTPPAGAFLQATRDGESALSSAVLDGVASSKRVVDLFAGAGTLSLPIAALAEVHAVEGDAAMLEALLRGWRFGSGLRSVTTEARDLFRRPLEPDELSRFDHAVLDPPRAGAEAQVRNIAKSDLVGVTMVSCNPVTFARDAQFLTEAGFRLGWVDVVDQFRWSTHVELVGSFSRA